MPNMSLFYQIPKSVLKIRNSFISPTLKNFYVNVLVLPTQKYLCFQAHSSIPGL